MPCIYNEQDWEKVERLTVDLRQLNKKHNLLTDMVCKICSKLTYEKAISLNELLEAVPELNDWLEDHKSEDVKRVESKFNKVMKNNTLENLRDLEDFLDSVNNE